MTISMAINVFASCNRSENTPENSTENTISENQINSNKMKITIGNQIFTASFANTISAEEFKKKLPLTLEMSDYGGFEKIATIDRLPNADKRENSLGLGDLMLYSGNTLVLFYDNHGGYSYTRIAKIDNTNGLREALSSKNVTITFSID